MYNILTIPNNCILANNTKYFSLIQPIFSAVLRNTFFFLSFITLKYDLCYPGQVETSYQYVPSRAKLNLIHWPLLQESKPKNNELRFFQKHVSICSNHLSFNLAVDICCFTSLRTFSFTWGVNNRMQWYIAGGLNRAINQDAPQSLDKQKGIRPVF